MSTFDRREFLARLSPRALRAEAAAIESRREGYIRPPGSRDPDAFAELCNACGDCVEACPEAAIHILESDTLNDGTPLMLPDQAACTMCDGFPCAEACDTDALMVPAVSTWKMGSVRVDSDHCFTFRGPECGACRDLCPTPLQALKFSNNKPYVEDALCVGCGLCIDACPTSPKAIVFEPGPESRANR